MLKLVWNSVKVPYDKRTRHYYYVSRYHDHHKAGRNKCVQNFRYLTDGFKDDLALIAEAFDVMPCKDWVYLGSKYL